MKQRIVSVLIARILEELQRTALFVYDSDRIAFYVVRTYMETHGFRAHELGLQSVERVLDSGSCREYCFTYRFGDRKGGCIHVKILRDGSRWMQGELTDNFHNITQVHPFTMIEALRGPAIPSFTF